MSNRRRAVVVAACISAAWWLLPPHPCRAATERVVRIGFVVDGPWDRNTQILDLMRSEVLDLVDDPFVVRYPDDKLLVADWTLKGVDAALDRLLGDPEVDLVVAMGILASDRACHRGPPPKPVVAPFVVDATVQGLPSLNGASGVHNLSYLTVPTAVRRDLREFHGIVPFQHLAILADARIIAALPRLGEGCRNTANELGLDPRLVPLAPPAERALAAIPASCDAAYLLPLLQFPAAAWDSLIAGLSARHLPTFSALGEKEVERGVLAGVSPDIFPQIARRLAVTVQRILVGEDPGELPTGVAVGGHLMINARTARAIGWYPSWAGLSEAEVFDEVEPLGPTMTFVESMRQALVSNIDLAATVRTTQAGQADVGLARSSLLPQVDTSLLGLLIDNDRAAASLGTQAERSLLAQVDATQVVFSEAVLARWSIEKSLQRSRERQLDQTRLDTARDAGAAYLDVLRGKTLERIRKENLQLTRSHLETARLLQAIGTGGLSDVYRWESELATNRKEAIDANALRNLAEIELNRILDRLPEEPLVTIDTDLDDPEVASSLDPARPYFDDKFSFRVLRDFLVQEGLATSPELQGIDAAIAASQRQLESATRAFYLPTVALQGALSGVWWKDGAGTGTGISLPGVPRSNDTDWSVGLLASYPIFLGGSRAAVRSRAIEDLASLDLQRQSAAQRIEQRIRSAVHRAGASYAGIREARAAEAWAKKNLDLVADSYARGAVSFVTLLDAQNAHVVAEQSAANAVYNFLDDWLEVQRAVGRFDFTRTPEERESFRARLQQFATHEGVQPR